MLVGLVFSVKGQAIGLSGPLVGRQRAWFLPLATNPVDGIIWFIVEIFHSLPAGPMVFGHEMLDFLAHVIVMAVFLIILHKVALAGIHDAHHVTKSIAKAKPMAQARAISARG